MMEKEMRVIFNVQEKNMRFETCLLSVTRFVFVFVSVDVY